MRMSFRWFGSKDDPITLQQIRQIPGVDTVVGALYDVPVGEAWPEGEIAALKSQIEAAGLRFDVVESVNVHDDIKIGLPSRDRYIENYRTTIERLGRAGVTVICYNFMPVFDWLRTELTRPLPDGSTAMAFDATAVQGMSPDQLVTSVREGSNGLEMPGWEPERLAGLQELFHSYEGIDAAQLRENLRYFLKGVVPACEKAGITMAIHPDDPPRSLFGLPRVVKNRDDLKSIVDMVDSPSNALTLCTGSLGENPDNDVPAIIREFVGLGRVAFAHVRNIRHLGAGSFQESAHLSRMGSLDLYRIVQALHDSGFDGYIRPDHGRMIWGETGRPGYGLYDRALGIAYIEGLWEAVDKSGQDAGRARTIRGISAPQTI